MCQLGPIAAICVAQPAQAPEIRGNLPEQTTGFSAAVITIGCNELLSDIKTNTERRQDDTFVMVDLTDFGKFSDAQYSWAA